MQRALLRLFNSFNLDESVLSEPALPDEDTMARTIRNGYILDPRIPPNGAMLRMIEGVIGISGEKANASFHKSWAVVRDAPMLTLMVQQIVHYITTYGFEELGIFNQETVYIPQEVLELPDVREDLPLIVIKSMTIEEIREAIVKLGSGMALGEETLDDMVKVVRNLYDREIVERIGNRELKARLYELYGIVPSESVEFLRHMIGKLTGESLIIKNDYLIQKIKEADGAVLDELLGKAPRDLASIFLRYKPLFLAMKSVSGNKTFFNRLRKQAKKLHMPLPVDYLNSITSQIKEGALNLGKLNAVLGKATIFRKIRLATALEYRLSSNDSTVYRVRNGRGWATEFEWPDGLGEVTQQALDIVLSSITEDIRANVEGRTIYIPSYVHYTLPATEKQFTGHFPTGSSVSVPEDMIVGIHWTNTGKRVDLDLSVIDESGKTGWDARYRTAKGDVLFSGDIVDAPLPNGASELFYLKEGIPLTKIMMVNYYNFSVGDEVEVKVLVAHENPGRFGVNYMVDVNNILASANINITRKQNVLGLIAHVDGENRFYFAGVSVGNSITAVRNEQSIHTRKYLVARFVDSLDLNQILTAAGANVVGEKPDGEVEYLNLSPQVLGKTTIMELLIPQSEEV